uniref:Tubulin polymerization promoting protein n=1 Tax=Suberites domuncula TaxID=55567 RepID=F1C7P7_SUBDO|nr:tubulin polymerization promoting protein [Suberites domuncula]
MATGLESTFNGFCSFGASKDGAALMDNAKFAKLFRDLKLLDKKFTSTDVDIIFNRPEVKAKGERKINFAQFQAALKLVAEKKYPGDSDGLKKLTDKILTGKGPATSGATKFKSSGAVDRLTDTSKYTGSHKERFDESGKGKGLEGRDTGAKGHGMAAGSVAGQAGYVSGYKHEGTYDKKK